MAHLVGLLCMGLGLSPRLAQLLTTIPLPVLGELIYQQDLVVNQNLPAWLKWLLVADTLSF